MNFLKINGVGLELRRIAGASHKRPLVFLHEGLGSVSLWAQRGQDWPQAVCTATGRAGLVYSRRGYGQSDAVHDVRCTGRLQPNYMHREAWEVLPALLQQLRIEEPVLLGHSDGATIALLHASRFAVSACIAMAPHVLVEDIALASIAQARLAFESGPLRERLARHHHDVDGAFWQWNDVWLSPGFRSFDIRPECQHIRAPLLLIQGLDDAYGTLRQLDEIARAAPHAQQVRLARCGHSPYRDQPEASLKAITEFLENCA
ncbi:MAG: alpha/beta hydrolase [Polaromonas sp.]|nr:alpha/beta hydrolase [Polaromonas sp.]